MTFNQSDVLRQLVEGMFAFVAVFTREGVLLEANQSALAATELFPEQLYGKHFHELEPLSHSNESCMQVAAMMQRAAQGEVVRGELQVRLSPDRTAVVDAMFMPLFDENERIAKVGVSAVEVTAHKKTEAALLRVSRLLRALSSCGQIMVRADREQDLLQQVCDVIVNEGGYQFAWVGFAETDAARSVRAVVSTGLDRGDLKRWPASLGDIVSANGPTACVVRCHSGGSSCGVSTAPASRHDETQGSDRTCSAAFPLIIGAQCIGALTICSAEPREFDTPEITLLSELANDLAFGLNMLRTRAEHSRMESQLQLFRRLLDRTDDMIYVVDAQTSRILDVSDAASRRLGYPREQLLRMNMTDISVPIIERPWAERVAQVETAGSLIIEGQQRCRDGTIFPVEVALRYVEQDHVRYLVGVTRDISERKRQQRLIEHMGRVLRMHSAINAMVLRIRERDELLREACRVATQLGGYARAIVSLVDPDGRTARPRFRAGAGVDFPEPEILHLSDGTTPDQNLVSRALRTGAIVVCNDLTRSEPPVANRELLIRLGFKTVVAMPLVVDGRRIGSLTLTSRDPSLVSDDELLLIQDMMGVLSFALRSQQHAEAFQFLASYDSLTGLARRSLFCQRLDDMLNGGFVLGINPVVAAFDIHHLSSINDSFGRGFGDLLLQKVAERLKRNVEIDEHIGYLGGGTFVLVEPDLSTSDDSMDTLLETTVFAEAFSIEGRTIRVSCRSGLARFPVDGRDSDTLVQKAEAALRHAKQTGEPYAHYKLEMHSEIAERLALEHRLREAIDAQQFELYYQPQVNIGSGRIDALEGLLRWNDPERGLVTPKQFLPVLESSGLIVPVGNWVLTRATHDWRRWLRMGLGPLRLCVNVSPLQLRGRTFVEGVLKNVSGWCQESQDCGVDLEITETALLQDVEGASRKLRELRASGLRIALDDFGTGYSSLGLLSQLPVDVLKIDRSFIRGLPADRASTTLAGSILALASAFELMTVAEGVETTEQLQVLRELKCDYSQGYLHSTPIPAHEVERLLIEQAHRHC